MPETIPDFFFAAAKKFQDRTALRYKINGSFSGQISWNDWADKVRATAKGLKSLGLTAGDSVGILAENSPFWTYADLGVLLLGGVVVPMYPTLCAEDLSYIVRNSDMKAVFVSTPEQHDKILQLKIPAAELHVITFYDSPSISTSTSIAGWLSKPCPEVVGLSPERSADDLATIIYTSGTTGTPKGVMLTHSNFIENFHGASQRIQVTPNDLALSFLPLSHVFERLAGYYFMAFSGAQIAYAESMQTVAEDIQAVQPTVAAAVPRFYEKVYAAIQAKLQAGGPVTRAIFQTALNVRRKVFAAPNQNGKSTSRLCFLDSFFDKIVFSKIRARIGGRLRFFISGGAPLSKDLAEFFKLCGILILEGYGLTETSPVIAVNTESEFKFGTVGKPLPNVRVKIAEDGEILTAGPCVMRGYFGNADATAEVLQDGWFHTGDIGEFDSDGYLKITDRKKDLIVTSGGKKVAPQKLEALVMRDNLFSQVVALGDKKPYVVALVVLNRGEAEHGAKSLGLHGSDYEDWIKTPEFYGWVSHRLQKQIEGVARFESIKSFAILSEEFSLQKGELTPTLKIKRRFVMDRYRDVIERLYQQHHGAAD